MSRPNQPLPRPSEMALAPPPNGIITPNTAGVGATVNLDTQAALAPALGMAKIGAGITEAGGALSQLSEKYAEAKSISQQAEAQRRMEEAETLITMETAAEPDETKWAAIADKHITKAKEAVSQIPMSVRTAEMVRPALDRWQMHRMDGVTIEAQKTGIKRAVGDLNYKIQNAKLTGNGAALEQNLAARRQLGASTDGQDENDRLEFQQEQQRLTKVAQSERLAGYMNSTAVIAGGKPLTEAYKHIDALPIEASDKVKLRNYAQGINRDGTAQLMGDVANGVATGQVWNEYELDATFGGSPFMSPALKKDMLESIAKFDARAAKEAKEGPDGLQNFVRTYTAAVNWKPVQHSEGSARELYRMIQDVRGTVPDDYAGEVTQLLHQKFGSTESSNLKLRPEIQRQTSKTIQGAFDVSLSPWKSATAAAKKAMDEDPSDANKAAYEAAQKSQLKAETTSFATQADIERQMREYHEKNPNAKPEEVLREINRIIPAGVLINHMEALNDTGGVHGDSGEPGVEGHSSDLIDMVKGLEGFSAKAFGDFKQTSIGYGTRAKHEGEVITKEEADQRLRSELTMHAKGLDAAAKAGGYNLTAKQRDALISFDFNTGRGVYLLESAGGNLREVERRMRLYTKAGGTDLEGLIKRRKQEGDLFAADISN